MRTLSPALVFTAVGVRAKRENLGLSRAQVALLSGLPVETVWEIEGGLMEPEHKHRVALMRTLDADFHELFTIETVNRPR